METITIKITKSAIKEIAEIIDLSDTTPIKVKDLFFTYGYFQEFPELQQYLDVISFNNLKSGKAQAVKFIGIN